MDGKWPGVNRAEVFRESNDRAYHGPSPMDLSLVNQLLVILAAGFVAGLVSKRLGAPLLVGYLIVGMLLGEGVLDWVEGERRGRELLAEGGVLLLLFSIGLEFSLDELIRLGKYLVVGGSTQMLLVIVPVALISVALGMPWNAALLIASATALSSTVLVYRALAEWGETESPHGRRAIGVLLFQDVALVPLLLVVPLLTGEGPRPEASGYLLLAAKGAAFLAGTAALHEALQRWLIPLLARFRSPELVVLFVVAVLGGVCWLAAYAGLPVSVGAFAAGLAFSGNRMTAQIDALVLPLRETFAAVFFVSLGLLLEPRIFWDEASLILPGLAAVIVLKAAAAAVALRLTGLSWRTSAGMGLGLAQLGEFSFVLVLAGKSAGVLTEADYQRMLAFALATLVLTPLLLKLGLQWIGKAAQGREISTSRLAQPAVPVAEAVVIGIGVTGRQVASQLELAGRDVCLVDLSPVNLHALSQQGFRTVAGNAADPVVLRRAKADRATLAVVCVPHDQAGGQIVRAIRQMNPSCYILVRCRYAANARIAKSAGANAVVSDEAESSAAVLKILTEIEQA